MYWPANNFSKAGKMDTYEADELPTFGSNFLDEINRKERDIYFHDMLCGKEVLEEILAGNNISNFSNKDISNLLAFYTHSHPDFVIYLNSFHDLTDRNKLFLVLTKELVCIEKIAAAMCVSKNSVRSIKSRIINKKK